MKVKPDSKLDSEDYVRQFILRKQSYTSLKPHFFKLMTTLEAIYENGSVSKWDLASTDKKKGMVPYSWVVVYKLVKELEYLGFVISHGVRKLSKTDRKSGKKHDVQIFGITKKGLAFLLVLDIKNFKHYESHTKEKGDEILYLFIKHVWNLRAHFSGLQANYDLTIGDHVKMLEEMSSATEKGDVEKIKLLTNDEESYQLKLRDRILKSLLESKEFTNIEYLILNAILSDIVDLSINVMQESKKSAYGFSNYTIERFGNLLHMGNYLGSIRREDERLSKELASYFLLKITLREIELEVIKDLWFELTLVPWPEDKSVKEVKKAVLVRLRHIRYILEKLELEKQTFYDLGTPFAQLKSISEGSASKFKIGKKTIHERILEEQKQEETKLKKICRKIIKDFKTALKGKKEPFLSHFSENVTVRNLREKLYEDKLEEYGIKPVKKWLRKLPEDCQVHNIESYSSKIDFDIRYQKGKKLRIDRISLDIMQDREEMKITEILISSKRTKDLKFEEKISNLKPDSSNKYSKDVLNVYYSIFKELEEKF